jgi:hypothetical protein
MGALSPLLFGGGSLCSACGRTAKFHKALDRYGFCDCVSWAIAVEDLIAHEDFGWWEVGSVAGRWFVLAHCFGREFFGMSVLLDALKALDGNG